LLLPAVVLVARTVLVAAAVVASVLAQEHFPLMSFTRSQSEPVVLVSVGIPASVTKATLRLLRVADSPRLAARAAVLANTLQMAARAVLVAAVDTLVLGQALTYLVKVIPAAMLRFYTLAAVVAVLEVPVLELMVIRILLPMAFRAMVVTVLRRALLALLSITQAVVAVLIPLVLQLALTA
jgi:hypothetical protein